MAKPSVRIAAIQFGFALGVVAILARAAQLQIVQGEQLGAARPARQRTERAVLPARRGALYDRNGVPLAVSQEFYHVGIAPNELADRAAAFHLLSRHLGVSRAALDRRSPGREAVDLFPRALHRHAGAAARAGHRHSPRRGFPAVLSSRELARPIIGGLSPDGGVGAAGLELSLDSILTGQPGEAVLLKDRAGRRYDSPCRLIREPVAGNDVVLTLDAELQEIAERGLDEAHRRRWRPRAATSSSSIPSTGELLALASRQRDATGCAARASTFTDPFEPGSTAKLFTAAALLMHRPGGQHRRGVRRGRQVAHAGHAAAAGPA